MKKIAVLAGIAIPILSIWAGIVFTSQTYAPVMASCLDEACKSATLLHAYFEGLVVAVLMAVTLMSVLVTALHLPGSK